MTGEWTRNSGVEKCRKDVLSLSILFANKGRCLYGKPPHPLACSQFCYTSTVKDEQVFDTVEEYQRGARNGSQSGRKDSILQPFLEKVTGSR